MEKREKAFTFMQDVAFLLILNTKRVMNDNENES